MTDIGLKESNKSSKNYTIIILGSVKIFSAKSRVTDRTEKE